MKNFCSITEKQLYQLGLVFATGSLKFSTNEYFEKIFISSVLLQILNILPDNAATKVELFYEGLSTLTVEGANSEAQKYL